MKNWAIPSTALSGSFALAGRDRIFSALAICWALAAGLLFCRPAQGSDDSVPKLAVSSALVSSLRLERITRLVQAYSPTPLPVFSCLELSEVFKPEDFSKGGAAPLVVADPAAPKLTLRFAWDETGLYTALEVRAAPETPLSGDIARMGFMEAGVGETKPIHEYILAIGENGLNLRPIGAGSAPTLTTALLPDGYQGEIKFLWPDLAPATPFSEGLILTLQGLSPGAAPATPARQYLLLMVPQDPGATRGYLSLVGPLARQPGLGPGAGVSGKVTGDGLVGQLYLGSPEPREIKLRLQIFRLAEGGQSEVVRIAKGVQLEQGVNTFRLYWDCGEAPEGNYLLQAVAAAGDKELYSRRLPFSLARNQPGEQ